MSNTLPKGFGTPFVDIFLNNGTRISENVVSFSYTYSEGSDDVCNIKIQTTDINLPDQKGFQEGDILKVIFGYLQGPKSRAQKVAIRSCTPHYFENEIFLEIKATDLASYLKSQKSTQIHSQVSIESLVKSICEKRGLKYNGVEDSEAGAISLGSSDVSGLRTPSLLSESGNYGSAIDNTSAPQFTADLLYKELPQANKSDAQLIKEVASKSKDPNIVVVGRDDGLTIRKRNFKQTPIRAYYYKMEDGELISFIPETKTEKESASSNVEFSGWDALSKEHFEGNANSATSTETLLGQNTPGTIRNTAESQEPDNALPKLGESVIINDINTLSRQNPQLLNESGFYASPNDNIRKPFGADFNWKVISTEDSQDKVKAEAQNINEQANLEKNPGVARVIGHPLLVDGKLVTILNVSKKHSGNYYLQEVKHDLFTASGYICTLSLSTNAYQSTENDSPNLLDANLLNRLINKNAGPEEIKEFIKNLNTRLNGNNPLPNTNTNLDYQ